MFNRIRQIHLFAAFILTAFVLMYFISGLVMIFENTFERKDNTVDRVLTRVPGIHALSDDSLLSELGKRFEVSGQYELRRNQSQTTVTFRHPGTEIRAVIATENDSVIVTKRKKNFTAVLHQFHRQHGYRGGWNYYLWAFFYDLSAVAMIIFAITGLYLWYKTERNKWTGYLILISLTLLTFFTIYYLMQNDINNTV